MGIWHGGRHQVTTFGQLMDPLADKLLIMAALLSLVQMELAPAWMVAIILGRELGVTVLRSVAFSRGVTISASPLGKVKMMSQVIAILLLILGREYLQEFFILGQIALWLVVVAALISAADYYRRFTQAGRDPRVTDFEAARRRTTEKRISDVEPPPTTIVQKSPLGCRSKGERCGRERTVSPALWRGRPGCGSSRPTGGRRLIASPNRLA